MLEIPDVIVVKPGVNFRSAMHMSIQRVMIGLASVMAWFLASPAVSWAIELPAGPLANLKAEAFLKRESAQAELLAWARGHPELAMDELFRYSKVADDPEVRERCLAVLHELVNDEYQKEGEREIQREGQDIQKRQEPAAEKSLSARIRDNDKEKWSVP